MPGRTKAKGAPSPPTTHQKASDELRSALVSVVLGEKANPQLSRRWNALDKLDRMAVSAELNLPGMPQAQDEQRAQKALRELKEVL